MDELTDVFEASRPQLRTVAYRMLGSVSEAEDAVQETWLRLSRSDAAAITNLRGWLTTVVARVALDMLRSRRSRREDPLDGHLPEPIVGELDDPEQQALTADAVGLALQVVLETLAPAERLAFVLHDLFAVSFDEIAPIVERSPAAARQLASRARRRVRGTPAPDRDRVRQRELVDAFLAAAREGDFATLLELLDPDVMLRVDRGVDTMVVRGRAALLEHARRGSRIARHARPALVNGGPGLVLAPNGRLLAVVGFTVAGGRIAEVDVFADRARLQPLSR